MSMVKCCAGCAEKLNKLYWMTEEEEEPRPGQCQFCFGYAHLSRYELTRMTKTYRKKSGGGEREKARVR